MKVLFLGIDALDSLIIDDLADQLPHLTALRRNATNLKLISTFPPDSDTAWATISTGLNPSQHGIVHFVDPLEKSYKIMNVGQDNQILQGKTFWELLSEAGYKTHAIFPHLCYPLWQTPGTGSMVVRGGKQQPEAQANPPHLLQHYPDPALLTGVQGFPDRGVDGLTKRAQKLHALTRADADFGLKLLGELDWDLFFIYWSTLDMIGHFFWNYYDRTDPTFVEGHPLQQVIPDTYRLYDQIIGEYLAAVDEEVTVIVMSDHGHGGRPFNLVNVNDILRQAGFLQARNLKRNPHLKLFEQAKRLGVNLVSRYGLARLAGKIMRSVPGAKESLTRPTSINWDETLAYASDMSGIKAYTYGGVIINQEALNGRDYEAVRSEIIALLRRACVLPDGTSLLDFIARREDLYQGPYITQYPDIVLEFKYGYGLGWEVNVPLITKAASQNLVPGSHRGATGTFLMRSSRRVAYDTIDLHDITPTILDLMNVAHPRRYDGRTALAGKKMPIY